MHRPALVFPSHHKHTQITASLHQEDQGGSLLEVLCCCCQILLPWLDKSTTEGPQAWGVMTFRVIHGGFPGETGLPMHTRICALFSIFVYTYCLLGCRLWKANNIGHHTTIPRRSVWRYDGIYSLNNVYWDLVALQQFVRCVTNYFLEGLQSNTQKCWTCIHV